MDSVSNCKSKMQRKFTSNQALMPFIFQEAILKLGAFPLGDLDEVEKSVSFIVSDMDTLALSFGLGSSSE